MGGSGSTGSSLLKNILNRHPDIFSGEETTFFAKKMIYDDWKKAKKRVLKKRFWGLRNHGWHLFNGTKLLHQEYLWDMEELGDLLEQSSTLIEFTNSFYQKPLEKKCATSWLEKTPANAACFAAFLNSFESGKVIHIVRNPLDTIASLQSRGYDLYYATGIYLLNTACGTTVRNSDRSTVVKYEDLTMKPEETIRDLCRFLEVSFLPTMLEPQGEIVQHPQLKGWNYDETAAIGRGSVGRFNSLGEEQQNAILEAVNLIHINSRGKDYYNTEITTIKEICELLEYKFYEVGSSSTSKLLHAFRNKDRMSRLLRGYPTGFYYPLTIKS